MMKKTAFLVLILIIFNLVLLACAPRLTKQEELLVKGKKASKVGNDIRAIEYYTKAIEIQTDFSDAFVYRGWSYYVQRNYKLAEADYKKAIELDPYNAEAYFSRGILYANWKKDEETIDDRCKKALRDYGKACFLGHPIACAYTCP